jgi:hypothetical protein
MATIIQNKKTGEKLFFATTFSTKEDSCSYEVLSFDGHHFVSQGKVTATMEQFKEFLSDYNYVGGAPAGKSIYDDTFDWEKYLMNIKPTKASLSKDNNIVAAVFAQLDEGN